MRVVEWEIKVSKLCNLRCAYCYEFAELGDRRRIPLAGWRAILQSARWYHEEVAGRHGRHSVVTRFVWHGGEPLLLPLSYYREVLALQHEILGADRDILYTNNVPTNLYALPPDTLAFLKEHRFQLAVSFDGIPGVRVNLLGKPTEDRVAANLQRLLQDGWDLGCNTVLAGHNAPRLNDVYDEIRAIVLPAAGSLYLNVIPLHATPTDDHRQHFSINAQRLVAALYRLFEHWSADPRPLPVVPLQDYYLNVLRKLAGLPRAYFDRRRYGESTLVVNTDGQVYVFGEAYERDKSLGCLFQQSFQEILRSEAYQASLDRQDALAARHCRGCPYDGYCNHDPLLHPNRGEPGVRCAIGYPLHRKIEAWLLARGYTAEALRCPPLDLPHLDLVTE